MDSAAERARIARRLLELSRADQTEILISSSGSALTRFAHEASNQNLDASDRVISVRAIVGGRTGVAQTNRFDDAALHDVGERARAMAALAPQDPLQGTLPSAASVQAPPGAFDAVTAQAGPQRRAQMCDAIFAQAERAGCWSAGFVANSSTGFTVANTSGIEASFDGTDAAVNVKMNARDSSGFAEGYANAVATLDASVIAHASAEKARASGEPAVVDPGTWTVILEPAAFGELIAYLGGHFSAQSYDEGSSFCSEGLDRTYFSETFTVRDDFAHPLAPGMPFDFEGHPTQRLDLVERGVARAIVTDSYYARKLERANTGHALPAPNAYGPQARNLVVAQGSKPLAQLIAETDRALLVTRLWYVRTVDQKRAIVTGMTRDGTMLVENGSLVRGVRNMRFNVSILDLLQNCEFSREQKRTGSYHYSLVVPAAKIGGFTFTSVTEF